LLEEDGRNLIDRSRTRPLAEPEDDEIAPERMHISTLERVVHTSLGGAIVQNSCVGKFGMMEEQGLHDDRFCPPNCVSHGPNEHMCSRDNATVASEKHVGQRG